MSASDKSAGGRTTGGAAQLSHRQALRRRRTIRLLGLLVVVVVVGALVAAGSSGKGKHKAAASRKHPAPSVACDGKKPAPPHPNQYATAPDPASVLQPGAAYAAVIHTSCGDIAMKLLADRAPNTVASFVFLATKGFYDGLQWQRVEKDFVIQTGDPSGAGRSSPDDAGYALHDELTGVAPKDYVYGVVALANAGPDTGGSQFFIVVHKGAKASTPAGLPPAYTIFAAVEPSSYATLDKIQGKKTRGGDDPVTAAEPIHPVYVDSIEISKS